MLLRVMAAVLIFIAGLCGLSKVDGQVLSGRVLDAITGEPISGAALMIDETTTGTASATDGTFRIPLSDVPAVLVVSHLSYQPTRIRIALFPSQSIEIKLEPASHDLGTVDIRSNPIVEIMKGTAWEILDFEFLGDNLLLMANENGNIYKPSLLLVSLRGDTLSCIKVDRPGEFYKDFEGNIYYLNNRSAWTVTANANRLHIEYMMAVDEFLGTYPLVVDVREPFWILKQYSMQRLKLSYYRYNEQDSSLNLFCSITNQPAIERSRWGAYFDGTPADLDFAARIINRPVEAPLFGTADGFLLFNFLDKVIECYDVEGHSVTRIKAPFMQDKNCSSVIHRDRLTGDFYTCCEKNGLTSLYKIDLLTGIAHFMVQIPRFVFVENIIIRNGEAFFLYKDKFREEQKKIFRMKL